MFYQGNLERKRTAIKSWQESEPVKQQKTPQAEGRRRYGADYTWTNAVAGDILVSKKKPSASHVRSANGEGFAERAGGEVIQNAQVFTRRRY